MALENLKKEVAADNIDLLTVEGFGEEWDSFDQTALGEEEWKRRFEEYFGIFPWEALPPNAEGFDLGCGSGRWAAGVFGRVGRLHCIDPSEKALAVARRRLSEVGNVEFHCAGVDAIPLADASQDFGYALGVLHHIPDTAKAMRDCVAKLKPGAPLLVYLYYSFDNRTACFRAVWQLSDLARRGICQMPFPARKALTSAIAALVYWPLSRLARFLEGRGMDVGAIPLAYYRSTSFYTMRTDALDRFGTRLEHRHTRNQLYDMMQASGLEGIRFSEHAPFWTALGIRRGQ